MNGLSAPADRIRLTPGEYAAYLTTVRLPETRPAVNSWSLTTSARMVALDRTEPM